MSRPLEYRNMFQRTEKQLASLKQEFETLFRNTSEFNCELEKLAQQAELAQLAYREKQACYDSKIAEIMQAFPTHDAIYAANTAQDAAQDMPCNITSCDPLTHMRICVPNC